MFMMHEGLASPGAQEVSSSMKHFVHNHMQPEYRAICSSRNDIRECCKTVEK